jgi:hypothetical protein
MPIILMGISITFYKILICFTLFAFSPFPTKFDFVQEVIYNDISYLLLNALVYNMILGIVFYIYLRNLYYKYFKILAYLFLLYLISAQIFFGYYIGPFEPLKHYKGISNNDILYYYILPLIPAIIIIASRLVSKLWGHP